MELIKITQSEGGKQVVSARELHECVVMNAKGGQKGEMFSHWIKRMLDHGFIENLDYAIQEFNYKGDAIFSKSDNQVVAKREYILTIETAKQIAMIQNNDQGRRVRKYFIECEKRLLKPQIPQTFAEALQLAADQAKQLELQAPKVQFADSILESNTSISVSQMAKILGYGPNNFFSILRDSDILMKFSSRKNTPYQRFIDAGYFEVTERAWVKGAKQGITFVTRVTPKGQKYLTKKFGTN
jgi:anti-repressor protein